jgi:putative endonuclease
MTEDDGYVYILKSERNETYYIGSAKNIENRFEEHNSGEVKYTKNLRPLVLMFSQKYNSIKETRRIEYKLKRLKNRNIIERIISDKKINMGV